MQTNFGAWLGRGYKGEMVPRRRDDITLNRLSGRTMGTSWSVSFSNPSMLALDVARDVIERCLQSVIDQMSNWEPHSEVSRYNAAPAGASIAISHEFHRVLISADKWWRAFEGAFDVTVAPLISAWGFGPRDVSADEMRVAPSKRKLVDTQANIGWSKVVFDSAAASLFQPGGMSLDLSGIAKGFAADHVADALAAIGIEGCLVDVGGELVSRGRKPDGALWRVVIAMPEPSQEVAASLLLQDCSVATSGDSFHAYEAEGTRYSHTIDPRTGAPISNRLASVSVVHKNCVDADAIATGLTVLGLEAGMQFATRSDIAAMFIERTTSGFETHKTPSFLKLAQ